MKHKQQMKVKNEASKLMAVMKSLTEFGSYSHLDKVLERLNSINPRNLPGDFSLKYYVMKSEIEGLLKYRDPTYRSPSMSPLFEPYAKREDTLKPDYELRSLPSVMRHRIKNANDVAQAVRSAVVMDICGIAAPKPTGGAGSEPPAAAKPTTDP